MAKQKMTARVTIWDGKINTPAGGTFEADEKDIPELVRSKSAVLIEDPGPQPVDPSPAKSAPRLFLVNDAPVDIGLAITPQPQPVKSGKPVVKPARKK